MSELNVIYQFNEKYVPYAGVSITSLLSNNRDMSEINIYVLGEELTPESIDLLTETAGLYGRNISFPDTAHLLERFKQWGMIPYRGAYSIYLRLFFTEIIDLAGKRALYLDSDTIIDKSLTPLIEHDLGDKAIGMVLESIRDDYKVMIGMSADSDYYNSGVILVDVDRWKRRNYCERLKDHILNVRSSYIGDQDFLNIVCEGDIYKLSPVYNYQPLHGRYTVEQYFDAYGDEGYYDASEIENARDHAVIYHCYRWLGEFPWHKGNLHPFNSLFDRYMALSEWKGYVKEGSSTDTILKIEKLLYRILPRPLFLKLFRKMHEMMLKKAENEARDNKANSKA